MKLYDKNQKNGNVKHYAMIDGQIVEVTIADVITVTLARKARVERTYKQKYGRCEDAPCCGCCS